MYISTQQMSSLAAQGLNIFQSFSVTPNAANTTRDK